MFSHNFAPTALLKWNIFCNNFSTVIRSLICYERVANVSVQTALLFLYCLFFAMCAYLMYYIPGNNDEYCVYNLMHICIYYMVIKHIHYHCHCHIKITSVVLKISVCDFLFTTIYQSYRLLGWLGNMFNTCSYIIGHWWMPVWSTWSSAFILTR